MRLNHKEKKYMPEEIQVLMLINYNVEDQLFEKKLLINQAV
jgi:hypothetical protein